MTSKFPARADARALVGAVLIGSAMGAVLGASYLAGGAARAALAHARTERLASAAADGFSETALQAQTDRMEPGALAVARRHDPFTDAGSAQRDLRASDLAARLDPPQPSGATMIRASLPRPLAPARPFHLDIDGGPLTSTRALDCLSDAVYYEARGESRAGQEAVAQVVLNRVRHPGFPNSICGVVFQGAQSHACQFSFACDGSTRRPREAAAWRKAQGVAGQALSGFVMAEVGDATNFHVAGLGSIWGSSVIKVAQIGAHVFYRLSGRRAAASVLRARADAADPPSELAEAPVYAQPPAALPSAHGGAPLILASAVATSGLGQGGPAGTPPLPASAPAAKPVQPPLDKAVTSRPEPAKSGTEKASTPPVRPATSRPALTVAIDNGTAEVAARAVKTAS